MAEHLDQHLLKYSWLYDLDVKHNAVRRASQHLALQYGHQIYQALLMNFCKKALCAVNVI